MRTLILLSCFFALCGPACAQKSNSQLLTEINTNLASGTNITAATLRGVLSDMVNSFPNNGGVEFTPEQIINVTDPAYGAVCDGVTNDNAAINAALAAAAASSAYQNNTRVKIVGPGDTLHKGCVINSLNFTMFTKGDGANVRPQVEFSNFTLLCVGLGNTCLDLTGAKLVKIHDVSIRGDNQSPPEICIQVSVINQVVSSAWHTFERVNCNNNFTFTALYN